MNIWMPIYRAGLKPLHIMLVFDRLFTSEVDLLDDPHHGHFMIESLMQKPLNDWNPIKPTPISPVRFRFEHGRLLV